ncbi:MAG: sensor histidine kinase [Cellulosilyticaceae bacterium]
MNSEKIALQNMINFEPIANIQDKILDVMNFPIVTVLSNKKIIGNITAFKMADWLSELDYTVIFALSQDNLYTSSQGCSFCIIPIHVDNIFIGTVISGAFYRAENLNIKNSSPDLLVLSEPEIMKRIETCNFLAHYFEQFYKNELMKKELLEYQEASSKAYLKVLESQINPHFLFNTLNSIARMAFLENSPNTEDLIYCLSDLLRYSIQQTEDFPTIGNEIQNIEKYLFIQHTRYSDRLNYTIYIPEEITQYRIPCMILQPIVENAIVHGIEPKADGGTIFIEAQLRNNHVVISVRDTGVGMSSQKLKMLLTPENSNPHIGVINPHQRLIKYFGLDYGLKISSSPNIGTTVEIHLPCFKEMSILENKI